MKPETQIRCFKPQLEELAEWYRLNKPQVTCIRLRRADWLCLKDNPEVARQHGFSVDDDGKVTYKTFDLVPTDCGARHAVWSLNPYK